MLHLENKDGTNFQLQEPYIEAAPWRYDTLPKPATASNVKPHVVIVCLLSRAVRDKVLAAWRQLK